VSNQPPIPSPARPPRPATRTPLVFLAMAGACVVAAGVGGYVAQSHRQAEIPTVEARPAQPRPAPAATLPSAPVTATPAAPAVPTPDAAGTPVPARSAEVEAASPVRPASVPAAEPVEKPTPGHKPSDANAPRTARVAAAGPAPQTHAPAPPARTADPAPAVEMPAPEPIPVADAQPPVPADAARSQAAKVSIAETFVIPADSVIGLELEHSVSSETAQPEDRVDARVARDVKIDGAVVIPAGSRVRGAVVRVENGGRFKERGRIEIRFHTLVLAGGDTQSIATDPLFREGENVGRKAGARIGASAAGGAIIGAIFGGEKGAAIGAAAGAGAGTAATAAQKPSEARFRAGAVVTVRLTAPLSITVEQ
jgi:hypothetical protein